MRAPHREEPDDHANGDPHSPNARASPITVGVSRDALQEIHEPSISARPGQATRKTFMTSSPRWLITFTAMRPERGLSNGRDVSLWRVAQASSSTSAFKLGL